MKKSLLKLKSGETGTILHIDGGQRMLARLGAMGVRMGKKVKVISRQPLRGPVALEIDNFCVAIGHGMAGRIYVK